MLNLNLLEERKITMEDLDTTMNLEDIKRYLHTLYMRSAFTSEGSFIVRGKLQSLYTEVMCKDAREFTVLDFVLSILSYLKIDETNIIEEDVVEYILYVLCKDIFADLGALISNAIPMEYNAVYTALFVCTDLPEESKDRMVKILLNSYSSGDDTLSFAEYNRKHWDLLRFLECLAIPAI